MPACASSTPGLLAPGAQGRARFQLYQKLLALAAAVIQAVGQLTYIRPFVPEWDLNWLVLNSLTLVAGAMILVHVRGPSLSTPFCCLA